MVSQRRLYSHIHLVVRTTAALTSASPRASNVVVPDAAVPIIVRHGSWTVVTRARHPNLHDLGMKQSDALSRHIACRDAAT
jgi:hypothetical protein